MIGAPGHLSFEAKVRPRQTGSAAIMEVDVDNVFGGCVSDNSDAARRYHVWPQRLED